MTPEERAKLKNEPFRIILTCTKGPDGRAHADFLATGAASVGEMIDVLQVFLKASKHVLPSFRETVVRLDGEEAAKVFVEAVLSDTDPNLGTLNGIDTTEKEGEDRET